jgi:dihydroflavonol-4-reductase
MKVCITGGNGFLASNIVRELLNQGHQVVALVRKGEDISTVDSLGIVIKSGDILDYDSVTDALDGCDALIHAAAITTLYPYRSVIQKKINVEGTLNVMNAALEKKLIRVVHIGTANSFGYGTKENPGNEKLQYSYGKFKLDYTDTKYEAQLRVLEMVKQSGLPAVIINPTFMFGPYSSKLGSAQMLLAIKSRKTPGYTKGGRNFVYVKDVAVAAVNALTSGKPGECYIAGNENASYKDIFGRMAKIAGVPPPRICIPGFLALAYGWLLTFTGKVFGFEPLISYRTARLSLIYNYYSSEKAVRELNLPQTPVDDAIKEAYEWINQKYQI